MKSGAAERAEQTIALLWRDRTERPVRRGPRPGRSIEDLIGAGIEIADADGLAALTVRRLAERVGLSRMAVYGYVADLDQLAELMVDTVHAELFGPDRDFPYGTGSRQPTGRRQDWQHAARTVADANLDLIRRHRWLVARPNDRPVLGPATTAKYDAELAVWEGLGLSEEEIDLALWQLLNHVRIAAGELTAADPAQGDADDAEQGESAADWWQASGAAAARWITAEEFPRAVRVGAAAGAAQESAYDPTASYRFGLERILAGLQVLVDSRAGSVG